MHEQHACASGEEGCRLLESRMESLDSRPHGPKVETRITGVEMRSRMRWNCSGKTKI